MLTITKKSFEDAFHALEDGTAEHDKFTGIEVAPLHHLSQSHAPALTIEPQGEGRYSVDRVVNLRLTISRAVDDGYFSTNFISLCFIGDGVEHAIRIVEDLGIKLI